MNMFNNIITIGYDSENEYLWNRINYSPEYKEYYTKQEFNKLIMTFLHIFFGAEILFFIKINTELISLCYILIVFLVTMVTSLYQSFISKNIQNMKTNNLIYFDYDTIEYNLSLDSWNIFFKLYIHVFGSVSIYSITNNVNETSSLYIVIITILTNMIQYYIYILNYNLHYLNSYSEINIEEIRKNHLSLQFFSLCFTLLIYVLGTMVIFSFISYEN